MHSTLKYSQSSLPPELSTTPAEESTQKNALDFDFYFDMFDLLTKKAAGKYFHYIIQGASISLWEDFTKAAEADGTYYQFNNEADLIQENPEWFRRMMGMKDGDESLAIELGTGSDHSVKRKTIPWVKAVNGSVYVAADEVQGSALVAASGVKEALPDTTTLMRPNVDFNVDNLRVEWNDIRESLGNHFVIDGKPIRRNNLPKKLPRFRTMGMFGSTLGNAEGFIGDPLPEDYVVKCLSNYRRHLRPGDILFMGIDQNQNKNSIAAAYGDERIARFSMALLKRIKDELPVSDDFDPDNFEYANQWFRRNNLFVHGFKAKTNGSFTIRSPHTGKNVKIPYKKNEFFAVYCNAFKFPMSFMKTVTERSGFTMPDYLADKRHWIHIHALQAN